MFCFAEFSLHRWRPILYNIMDIIRIFVAHTNNKNYKSIFPNVAVE